MSNEKRIVIPYKPREQLAFIHPRLEVCEEACLVIHRRGGKTVLLINHIIKKAMQFPGDDGEYAFIAPFLKQAKRIAWKYLKKYTNPIPGRLFSESELTVVLPNGSRIGLYGADNPEALRGVYLDGAVLDEFAQIDPDVYESILSPALMDRNGWVVFSGTPNGKNQLWKKLIELRQDPAAFTCVLNAEQSRILTEEQLKKARKRCGTQEKYDREYGCSFDSIAGKKIYPEFNYHIHVAKHSLVPSPTDPLTIIRGIDNTGLSPAWILSYLTVTGQWRIFKEFCFSDVDIRDAAEAVILWCQMNLHSRCQYMDFGDPAGKGRDSIKMSAKRYIILKAREMGQDINIVDGIQTPDIRWSAVRGRLSRISHGEPAILIDPSCEVLIEGFMGGYSFKEMVGMPGVFLKKADKNFIANVHDALQYPATRLFLSSEAVRAAEDAENGLIYDDEDNYGNYSDSYDSRTGRSATAGY
jgi:hypothetical protein